MFSQFAVTEMSKELNERSSPSSCLPQFHEFILIPVPLALPTPSLPRCYCCNSFWIAHLANPGHGPASHTYAFSGSPKWWGKLQWSIWLKLNREHQLSLYIGTSLADTIRIIYVRKFHVNHSSRYIVLLLVDNAGGQRYTNWHTLHKKS